MIKTIITFTLFLVIGVACVYAFYTFLSPSTGFAIPQLTPITTKIRTFTQQLPTHVTNLTNYATANIGLILTTAGGVGTIITLFYETIYKRLKARSTQAVDTAKFEASQKVSHYKSENIALKESLVKAQLESVQDPTGLQASLKESETLVIQKQTEIHDLQLRYQGQIDALHAQIEKQKLKVHETVVVK